MADRYIQNQRKIIKKRLMKTLPSHIVILLFLSLLFGVLIFALGPCPQSWITDEITIVDIQYRHKPRTLARYASAGYEIVDQNGNLYWTGNQLSWEKLGASYSIQYFNRGSYRKITAVAQGDTVILLESESVSKWKRDANIIAILLFLCVVFLMRQFLRMIRDLRHPEIQECRKRIQIQNAKASRAALGRKRK